MYTSTHILIYMKVHAVNLLPYPCPQGGASARTKMPFVSSLSPSFFLPRSYRASPSFFLPRSCLPIIPDGPPI